MIYYVEKFDVAENSWIFFREFEYKKQVKKYLNDKNYRVTIY